MAHRKKENEQTTSTRPKRRIPRYIYVLWGGLLLTVGAIAMFFYVLSKQKLPTFEDLENPDIEEATTAYAAGGEVLGRYYVKNRVLIQYDELNPYLVQALVATEDKRYYDHAGIDFTALGRVAVKTALLGQTSAGGGSTITQQLAKRLYTGTAARNLAQRSIQKLKEWITAVKLERSYTKEEIMAMYLNEFEFINGAHGIQAAAETYFGKSQENLSVQEAAVLIGMLKNPSLYRPDRFPENAKNRRNTVIMRMASEGHFTEATRDSLWETSVDMSRFKRTTHVDGVAPYFRAELAKDLRYLLKNEASTKPDGTPYNLYRDGLKIYTTIDYKMQALAEKVAVKHMKGVQQRYFTEWKSEDPWTYEDEKLSEELKLRSLQLLVMGSERYQSMLRGMYGDQIANIEEDIDGELRPVDLHRLLKTRDDNKAITKLLTGKIISKKQANQYRDIIKSKAWTHMMSDWDSFDKKVDAAFDKKVKMTVFAYNDRMETDTTMSPLDSIRYYRMQMQVGMLAVEPQTGHVKVWIGGSSHKHFQYDHIRTDRQVGSTFKPFIYASAIFFKGISPCYKVVDAPYTISPGEGNFRLGKPWTPKNARGEYSREELTLYEGLRTSTNTTSVYLMKQLGDTGPVRGLVHQMGIDSSARRANGSYRVPEQPSICLGSADLSVLEMTGAYATFANKGVYVQPTTILRIEDKHGRTIYAPTPVENVVLDERRNYVILDMLRNATSKAGGFYKIKSDVGGKTGTTNDHTDGWFMGVSPNLVVGTWVGGEDKWIRFKSFANGQGSRMARPLFLDFMVAVEADKSIAFDTKTRFERPADDLGIVIDCEKYEQLYGQETIDEGNSHDPEDDFDDFDDF